MDFRSDSHLVTFTPGQTVATLQIPVLDDSVQESREYFRATVTSSDSFVQTGGRITVYVNDNTGFYCHQCVMMVWVAVLYLYVLVWSLCVLVFLCSLLILCALLSRSRNYFVINFTSVSIEANPTTYTVGEGENAVITLIRSGAIDRRAVVTVRPSSGSARGM